MIGMNGSNIGSGNPFRSNFPGGTFAYGCPPIDIPPAIPDEVLPGIPYPGLNPFGNPFNLKSLKPEMWAFTVCEKCKRHVRAGEPCPWCLRADLDALKVALGDKAKPVEEIAAMRTALQHAVETLREVSRALGSSPLDEVIAECERALVAKDVSP
jgi:hypothetical protein